MFSIEVKKKLHSSQGSMLLDVTLQIERGKFISLYGKSGAGKTTLLKILAGLVQPEAGLISTSDQIWFNKEKNIDLVPQKRKIGFVFQDYALFPNMTIQENLEFVLPNKKNKKRITEILDIMELTELSSRYPSIISGGQQQRVGLARALVREPELLLLDEPFSSLDHETRLRLQDEIVRIHKHFGLTTIMISHDHTEIIKLSDLIVELDFGKIIRQGKPSDFFNSTQTNKDSLTGEIVEILPTGNRYVIKIISENNTMNTTLTNQLASGLRVGDKVSLLV